MKWLKENPVLSSLLGILLLASGGMTYLAIDSSASHEQAVNSYSSEVKNVENIKKRSLFPNEQTKKKIESQNKEYKEKLNLLINKLSKMEAPLEPITPQEFQDKLRNAVNQIRSSAQDKKVKLPEKFFLGFDDYQSQLPTPELAPLLFRELKNIQNYITQLINLQVSSIDRLERKAADPQPTPTPTENVKNKKDKQQATKAPAFTISTFNVGFTAALDKCRYAINDIPSNNAFLIIRNLDMENSKPMAPSKKASAEEFTGIPDQNKADTRSNIKVILGQELVKTSLTVEIFDFADPQPEESKSK
jgi:hypothetical protein